MRLALIGYGNISTTLLTQLGGQIGGQLDAVSVLVRPDATATAQARLDRDAVDLTTERTVCTDLKGLMSARPDLVVECAGHTAVQAFVPDVLRAGTDVVLVSIGALADSALHDRLLDAARKGGARLILPAGAVGGIDLLAALGPAGDLKVSYRGIKPPTAWAGTPAADTLNLETLDHAAVFFTGTARQAASAFPRNANVAATLALAGAGFEATRVELIADPQAPGNIHEYKVSSPLARYSMRIENLPSPGNSRTSVATVYSVLREIRNRIGPVAI
ncbi:aspartate dehydrogenase [Sedimentitalea todarodis]|uniref:L-aspartate dehydrogenase n=1 Tax=Sedimentitalea todarodis TaxID=1631240 RepID=A0ABU3VGB8_9RHOB|nr:aspartate dehydrogenase [Sedimentitalea todarodis]MDU9005242.1 aspartate dehydrogenase [Sedimentitalea todarodis]